MVELLPNEYFSEIPYSYYMSVFKTENYLVSTHGRIYNKIKDELVICHKDDRNNVIASIAYKDSLLKYRTINVAIIVLLTFSPRNDFIGRSTGLIVPFHLDGDNSNNHIDNLIWNDGIKYNKQLMMRPAMINLNCNPIVGELWRYPPHIKETEDIFHTYYLISTYGRIYSTYAQKLLSLSTDRDGYKFLTLTKIDGKSKKFYVHRLVMYTFNYIDNCGSLQVNHIDGNKQNNHISNLEWVTSKENVIHAFANNLSDNHFGINNLNGTRSKDLIYSVLDMYFRLHLPKNEIMAKTGISHSGLLNIISGNARIMDLFNYCNSIGIENPFDLISLEELAIIKDNLFENSKNEFNYFLDAILHITNTSLKYPIACIIRNALLDKNSWIYKKYFTL